MRRAVPIVFATLLGLGLLANFHTSPAQTVSSTPGPARPTTPVTTPTPVAGASPPRTSGPSTAPSTTAPAATLGTRVVDGPAVVNRYGPVQVEVTLSGDRIVDVQALELPSDRAKSVRINDVAGPLLREEALTAQSARVDTVSGATYTSLSYQQSLQAALDQAGIS
jgi:uncharacterized protein with FMN-binding domain